MEVPLVSSLGFLVLLESLALVMIGSDQQAFPPLIRDFNWRVGGLVIGAAQLISLVVSISLVTGLSLLLGVARCLRGGGKAGAAQAPLAELRGLLDAGGALQELVQGQRVIMSVHVDAHERLAYLSYVLECVLLCDASLTGCTSRSTSGVAILAS